MEPDYERIREDNRRRYGTDVGQYGKTLLADLYSENDHFVFELLQNTEDAYGRQEVEGKSLVEFEIDESSFKCRHFGKPFDEADIAGVCGIAASTKESSDIGKFGIGFKSVFSVTDKPQIHSGDASFEIVDYVLPHEVNPVPLDSGETLIYLPLGDSVSNPQDLLKGLVKHGSESLLFLRHIDTIIWTDADGQETRIQRVTEEVGKGVQRVSLVESRGSAPAKESDWLLFSQEAESLDGDYSGTCQLAFKLDEESGGQRVQRLSLSPISVVFPTAVESQLGFLIQAPFRTTPSRDNLRSRDDWNDFCFQRLSKLMVDALEWFKENGMLQSEVFEVLPIDPEDIEKAPLIEPMHDALIEACKSRELIPVDSGGHATAGSLRLGRSAELRGLLDEVQLAALSEEDGPVRWVAGNITQDRFPRVRSFLMDSLGIDELTPETAFREMEEEFLSAQPDSWFRSLYEFLGSVPRLADEARTKPILRLHSGETVAPFSGELPNAVLPSGGPVTDITIRPVTCDSSASVAFLESLGLEVRQLVDDAIEILEEKYSEPTEVSDDEYSEDVRLFLEASSTDSRTKLDQLHSALADAHWVRVVDAGKPQPELAMPDECYGPRKGLVEIFGQVPGIKLVDWNFKSLVGREIEALLQASGVAMKLRTNKDNSRFSQPGFLEELRATSDQPETTGYTDEIVDYEVAGLEKWLNSLKHLDVDSRRVSSSALWKELVKLAGERQKVFRGTYRWTNYGQYKAPFDSLFVEQLRSREWVPNSDGDLRRPNEVEFEATGFEPNPFLEEVIPFKPAALDDLAEQAGIEPEAIALLKRLDISAAQLREQFGGGEQLPSDVEPADDEGETEQVEEGADTPDSNVTMKGSTQPGGSLRRPGQPTDRGPENGKTRKPSGSPPGSKELESSGKPPKGRKFLSYIAADLEKPPDPDQLSHAERIALEEKAIEFILEQEPEWERTAKNNPGFDLQISAGNAAGPERLCEVKAMRTTLKDRPVTLSRRQFETAIEKGDSYWLYIVERADSPEARLIAIQDPAGKAKSFTFDQGWREAAP